MTVTGRDDVDLASKQSFPASDPPSWTTGAAEPHEGGTFPFELRPLPYAHDALEPAIDTETMAVHHGLHHRTYVEKLNEALEDLPQFHNHTLPQLLAALDDIPEAQREAVRNNGGGHANHDMLWRVMKPGGGTAPEGALADAIDAAFGSFSEFQAAFESAGKRHFGSGWVFLVSDPAGTRLEILTLPNQDTPLQNPDRHVPLLLNDVWEHAYYLKHRNRRPEYLSDWWGVVNWSEVGERFEALRPTA